MRLLLDDTCNSAKPPHTTPPPIKEMCSNFLLYQSFGLTQMKTALIQINRQFSFNQNEKFKNSPINHSISGKTISKAFWPGQQRFKLTHIVVKHDIIILLLHTEAWVYVC